MTPPLDLDALAREACEECYSHGVSKPRLLDSACRACILSALRKVEEQARPVADVQIKYGRDHSSRITLGAMLDLLLANTDDEKFLDALDSEFIYGCYAHLWKEPCLRPSEAIDFLRDLRGLVLNLGKRATEQARAEERERCAQLADDTHSLCGEYECCNEGLDIASSLRRGGAPAASKLIGPELAAAVNALPDNVRAYIHDLETNADPAGTIQELAACRENVAGLAAMLEQAKVEERERLVLMIQGCTFGTPMLRGLLVDAVRRGAE